MKNKIIFVVVVVLILVSSVINIYSQEYRGAEAQKIVSNADYVVKDSKLYIPTFIRFTKGYEIEYSNWINWLHNNFKISNYFNFILIGTEKDNLNQIHYRYQETYKGIPIHGCILIVHTFNNRVVSLNGTIINKLDNINNINIDENKALDIALNDVNATKYMWQIPEQEILIKRLLKDENASYYPKAELTYISENNNYSNYTLTYKLNVYAAIPLSYQYIYIDVSSGKILIKRDKIHIGNATGTAYTKYSGQRTIITDSITVGNYVLRETTRGNGIETYNCQQTTNQTNIDFTDTDNIWNNINAQQDEIATDAHWGAEMTYDYFFYNHNRNSIDNNGYALVSYVHYNLNYTNAYWNGSFMTYGDGDSTFAPFTTLDICGHEIAHGLTQYTANLDYINESGALNEGFSDIFGTCIEWYAKPPQTPNWTIGEDAGYPFRDMSNPNSMGDPDTYFGNNWYVGTSDNGGVHTNSGVFNYWFYLLTSGGSGINDINNSYNVTGLGIDTAAQIAYRALTVYLTNSSVFNDARLYTIQAAADLYGSCSNEVQSVTNAWYAVGVGAIYSPYVICDFKACPLQFSSTPAIVTFSNQSTNASTYLWDFGDGTTSNTSSPTHTYNTTGNFNVKLVGYGGICGNDSLTKNSFVKINSSYPNPVSMTANATGTTLTSCTGVLFDSGGCDGSYLNNTSDTITIAPISASYVILNFISLGFETNYDYLYIYDGPNTSSNLIGQYDGTALPNGGTISSTGNSITLVVISDMGVTASGFELNWVCSSPNNVPTANFSTNYITSCSGTIQFTDKSLNFPTQWNWNFGDGTSSNSQNPIHTYTSSGNYTVSLISTNSNGNDTIIKTNYINVVLPDIPVVTNNYICVSGSTTLSASGSGTLNWYNSSTSSTIINTGVSYITPSLTTSTTYYVENVTTSPHLYGGKLNNTGSGSHLSNPAQYLIFNCYNPTKLISIDVYANSTGIRIFELRDSSGTVLQTDSVNITTIGLNTIPLNFSIPVGNYLQLGLEFNSQCDLYRNIAGVTYPYTSTGLISIINSSAGSNIYYYCYNWKITPNTTCVSTKVPVTANVIQITSSTVTISSNQNDTICTGTNVTFVATTINGGSSPTYNWFVNSTPISGNNDTISISTLANNDSINCIMITNYSCSSNNTDTSNVIKFTVLQSPSAGTLAISQNPICIGGTTTLSVNGNTNNVQWQNSTNGNNWTNIQGANSTVFTTPTLNGSTYYREYVNLGTCSDTSAISLINVGPIGGNIIASNDTLCNGDTLILTLNNYVGNIQWQESANGNTWSNINNASSPTFIDSAFTSQNYYRAILSISSCTDSISNPIHISLMQMPIAGYTFNSTINTVSFANTSVNSTTYLWDFGDGTTSTQINPNHTYSTSGNYTVTLTAFNGCGQNISTQVINIISSVINNFSANNYIEVFPNPNNGIFDIKLLSNDNKNIILSIYSIDGRKIYTDNISIINSEALINIDLSKFDKGIYNLEIISKSNVYNKVIIIQ